ncbi:MAG: Txe/YoeB family addiction module toxin [Tannerellaceae bacterium]|jgi:toxin YoeB|nr:Txe/YoeB family addiction module toxin [Tannerellaceae bacterium]
MKIIFTPQAQLDYEYWRKSGQKALFDKINRLLIDISEHPYTGIGKPEALKYELAGKWSRRINTEHRIIYSVHQDTIEIYVLSMRYHYSKR